MSNKPTLYYFFPLASVGGTESVHGDILSALRKYPSYTYIRHRGNVWRGRDFAKSKQGLFEGKAMMHEYSNYSKLKFISPFLEAPRFGRIIRKFYTQQLAKKINRSMNPIVIFWHRESIEFLWPYLESHVKIVDIVHNNSNNEYPDAEYLVNDWVPRINHRVLVSSGLRKWLDLLYATASYPEEYKSRWSVIQHMVHFPNEGFIKKSNEELNVLFIGRDAIEKRFNLVLDIAKILESSNSNIKFHIVGPEPSRYIMESQSNIIWHGEITDRSRLSAIYRLAHVILLTSSSEGFPKVFAEGMAFSCVPLTTAVGGIPDQLCHNNNSLFTDPNDCVEQSVLFLHKLNNEPKLFHNLSKNAYLYARDNFDPKNFEHDWNELISSLS